MSHNNVPILIITAPPQASASDNPNPDITPQAIKQRPPVSHSRGNGSKSNVNRVRRSKQNDKSEPLRRSEVNISYNNASLLSIEKKLHDESALDNISNTSRSIFSTESPRDIKNIPSIKQNSYYLGVINPNDALRSSNNNPRSLYAGGSGYPSITLDESNAHAYRNEGSTVIESNPKNTSKVQSLNSVQSKRPSSIGNKLYHGFKRPYASQNLSDQTESIEMPRLVSPQQKDLKPPASGKAEKEKQVEEPVHVPRPPSKGPINKARTLGPPVLDHRRPKKAGAEAHSIVVKTNLDLDTKAYSSLPVDYGAPQSMINLPSQDHNLENATFSAEPYSSLKHRRLRQDVNRKSLNRTSLNGKMAKENELYSQNDLSTSQNMRQNIKLPLKPLSGNANTKRTLNNKAPSSELRAASKDELMKRFNEIVTYQTQPGQAGNPQVLQEKNKNEGNGLRPIASAKDKENARRRSVKLQNENKPAGNEVQKSKKPAEVSIINSTDAKIMMLKNKIKDKEIKRKTRKNQRLEEGEGEYGANGVPLRVKFAEHMGNKSEMEEDMKKKLLVMRKIQLYDILIKNKTGKKLKKEALKLVKAEFDKVNQELSELKLHEQYWS